MRKTDYLSKNGCACSLNGSGKRNRKNISRLKGYEPVQGYVERIMKEGLHYNIAKTQYTDDSKITDHYAIIPTGQLTELRSLNELQRSVYDLIVRRFLSIFIRQQNIRR